LVVERYYPDVAAISAALDRSARSHADRDWFGQVLDTGGRVVSESDGAPALDWLPAAPAGPFDLGGFRVVRRPPTAGLTARTGSSLRFITEDVDTLTRVLVLAGGAILLVAPPVGYW